MNAKTKTVAKTSTVPGILQNTVNEMAAQPDKPIKVMGAADLGYKSELAHELGQRLSDSLPTILTSYPDVSDADRKAFYAGVWKRRNEVQPMHWRKVLESDKFGEPVTVKPTDADTSSAWVCFSVANVVKYSTHDMQTMKPNLKALVSPWRKSEQTAASDRLADLVARYKKDAAAKAAREAAEAKGEPIAKRTRAAINMAQRVEDIGKTLAERNDKAVKNGDPSARGKLHLGNAYAVFKTLISMTGDDFAIVFPAVHKALTIPAKK